jgi:uncharacterized protein
MREFSMYKRLFSGLLILALSALMSAPVLAEPSIQQVYQAAESGKLNDAQAMMREVLKAHPTSAKAHFVEAELLAKQGQIQDARSELANAERLSPGLSFAKPGAVQNLRGVLGEGQVVRPVMRTQAPMVIQRQQPSFPWGIVLVVVALVVFMVWVSRLMARRNAPTVMMPAGGAYPANGVQGPYGAPGPMPYGGGPMMGGGGMGSGILGGLATGAAVGAGMVAGEALMHRVMGGGQNDRIEPAGWDNGMTNASQDVFPNDMGGNDFGLNDMSSWDGGGGDVGGGDWS